MNGVGGPRGRQQLGDCQNHLNVKGVTVVGVTVGVEIDGQDQNITVEEKKKSFRFHGGLDLFF